MSDVYRNVILALISVSFKVKVTTEGDTVTLRMLRMLNISV